MGTMTPEEEIMATPIARLGAARAENLSTRELVAEISGKVSLLVKKEVELAKTEMKANVQAELAMLKAMVAAAVAGLLGLNTLLVAVVFALALKMPGWLAALIVGGVVLILAAALGYLGWSWRVTAPLAMTRKTIKEDVQWARERVA
jgi:membrane-bound ClpP family serine protease